MVADKLVFIENTLKQVMLRVYGLYAEYTQVLIKKCCKTCCFTLFYSFTVFFLNVFKGNALCVYFFSNNGFYSVFSVQEYVFF